MEIWQAIILAIVEGLTEFLPVSSTGHMIITQAILGMQSTEFVKVFTVSIQFGTILSVVVLYWKRLFQSLQIYYKLAAAFLPTAVLGLLFNDLIEEMLESVVVVATMLLLGGIVLILIDRFTKKATLKDINDMSYVKAMQIGFFQSLAMVPGVSRSAATIIGGQFSGLDRKQAAEFSFLLAIPTMAAATLLSVYKNYKIITSADLGVLALGNLVGFVVAIFAIRFFVNYLTKHGFFIFGVYRIVVGLIILACIWLEVPLEIQ